MCKELQPFIPYYVNDEDGKKNSKHVGVYVGYSPVENSAVIVFRGSDFLINFIQDMQYYKIDADYPACGNLSFLPNQSEGDQSTDEGGGKKRKACRVHSGFFDDWTHVRPNVLNATLSVLADHPSAAVWVTGHSLGGAIACLCALDLALTLERRDVALLTFGEPRVGNIYFAAFVRAWLPSAVRVVHQDDAVPHLPPQGNELLLLTAFHHHASEVWQTGSKDDTFLACDGTGEDPRCSDSLLPWDRSVEAHRWYLGWPLRCSP